MIRCPICGKEFYTVSGLRSHLAVKHPGELTLSFEDVKKAVKIALYEAEAPLSPAQLLLATKTTLRRAFLTDISLRDLKPIFQNALEQLIRSSQIRIYIDPRNRRPRYGLARGAAKRLRALAVTPVTEVRP